MKVSFIIATLNEIRRLPPVIESIRAQNYPPELIEIVVVDGLSDDGTQEYARSAGCVVIDNPRRLAEPGHLLGYAAATGDLLCIIAADNILHTPDFITRIVEPFCDPYDLRGGSARRLHRGRQSEHALHQRLHGSVQSLFLRRCRQFRRLSRTPTASSARPAPISSTISRRRNRRW